MKKCLALVLTTVLFFSYMVSACGKTVKEAPRLDKDLVILYTNDVHCGISGEDSIGYAGLSALKKSLEKDCYVLLADAGDSVQGGPIGVISQGEYLIDIMNHVGYDVAIPGNHEFDYGMDRFLELRDMAEFPYLSCNLTDLRSGARVLDAYRIFEAGGIKLAFVGITTPETLRSSVPKSFKDDKGEFIYGFCQDNEGEELYDAVQTAVDAARAEGADYVIALGHLGVKESCSPWTSAEVIANTTGIDILIDGHSHTTMPCEMIKNAYGKEVICTQTGTKLSAIGKLVIGTDGKISASLVTDFKEKDADTEAFIAKIQSDYEGILANKAAYTPFDLVIYMPNSGKSVRIIRNNETNLGDLITDAYRTLGEADISLNGGGNTRDDIAAGDISFKSILTASPFGNCISTFEVSGQQIIDALEFGARSVPDELGGFLQVSGLSYEIHSYIASAVKVNENGEFDGYDGEQRRVRNIMIAGEPVDPGKTYTAAGTEYIFESCGDGYTMFKDCKVVRDMQITDFQALAIYLMDTLGGAVPEQYAEPYGQGRIQIFSEESAK